MIARSYIRDNIDSPYSDKLLGAIDSYLRRESIHFHEYKVQDLASDLDTIGGLMGVGQVTIHALRDNLKADGYL